jgi:hypothetical protein
VDSASKPLAGRFAFAVTKRLASILLPIGFGLGDFISSARAAFVEAAADQIKKGGNRPTAARIAVVTGMSRAEVARTRRHDMLFAKPFAAQRTERVMHGWFADAQFVEPTGNPRALPMTGPRSFDELVRKYSGDIPRRAVLDELLAGGMAEITESGSVKALRRHYLLASGQSVSDLDGLAADSEVFFHSAIGQSQGGASTVRRVSTHFRDRIPPSVRRTVILRTERFVEALADYLHASANSTQPPKRAHERNGETFHLLVTQCQVEDHD